MKARAKNREPSCEEIKMILFEVYHAYQNGLLSEKETKLFEEFLAIERKKKPN